MGARVLWQASTPLGACATARAPPPIITPTAASVHPTQRACAWTAPEEVQGPPASRAGRPSALLCRPPGVPGLARSRDKATGARVLWRTHQPGRATGPHCLARRGRGRRRCSARTRLPAPPPLDSGWGCTTGAPPCPPGRPARLCLPHPHALGSGGWGCAHQPLQVTQPPPSVTTAELASTALFSCWGRAWSYQHACI